MKTLTIIFIIVFLLMFALVASWLIAELEYYFEKKKADAFIAEAEYLEDYREVEQMIQELPINGDNYDLIAGRIKKLAVRKCSTCEMINALFNNLLRRFVENKQIKEAC